MWKQGFETMTKDMVISIWISSNIYPGTDHLQRPIVLEALAPVQSRWINFNPTVAMLSAFLFFFKKKILD